ncbi:MAG TPA: hypothetical protein VK694_05080 [Verrucomicrobiae bacterium]|nr:hypothetical protein [Verrucomicrobiae bacterium]
MSAEVRTGKSVVIDQHIGRPAGKRVSRRRASFEDIHAHLGISQPERNRLGGLIQPGDEFLLFLNVGRTRRRTPPVMGVGVILRDHLQEGDVIFSGEIKVPKLGDPTEEPETRQGTFHFDPEMVDRLSRDDYTNVPLAARGAADLIATRVFHLDPVDTELETTYDALRANVEPMSWVNFHERVWP